MQIPEVKKDNNKTFGLVKVKGFIDEYEIKNHHLMPLGNGSLMLAVKLEIRKKINKNAGDTVHIILYPDNDPLIVPHDLITCLADEPAAKKFFHSLSDSEKKYYIQWIYAAKTEATKINRMAKTVNRLARKLKMYDKDEGL